MTPYLKAPQKEEQQPEPSTLFSIKWQAIEILEPASLMSKEWIHPVQSLMNNDGKTKLKTTYLGFLNRDLSFQ